MSQRAIIVIAVISVGGIYGFGSAWVLRASGGGADDRSFAPWPLVPARVCLHFEWGAYVTRSGQIDFMGAYDDPLPFYLASTLVGVGYSVICLAGYWLLRRLHGRWVGKPRPPRGRDTDANQ